MSKSKIQIDRDNIEAFIIKVNQFCWAYGCEIAPTHPVPEDEHPTIVIKSEFHKSKLVYIDGDGIDRIPKIEKK